MAVLQSNWRQGVPTTALREFVSRVPLAKRCIFVVGGGFSHLSASLLSLPQVPWEPCDDAFSFSPSPDALSPLPPFLPGHLSLPPPHAIIPPRLPLPPPNIFVCTRRRRRRRKRWLFFACLCVLPPNAHPHSIYTVVEVRLLERGEASGLFSRDRGIHSHKRREEMGGGWQQKAQGHPPHLPNYRSAEERHNSFFRLPLLFFQKSVVTVFARLFL